MIKATIIGLIIGLCTLIVTKIVWPFYVMSVKNKNGDLNTGHVEKFIAVIVIVTFAAGMIAEILIDHVEVTIK